MPLQTIPSGTEKIRPKTVDKVTRPLNFVNGSGYDSKTDSRQKETKIPATDEDRKGFLLAIAMDTSEKVPDPFSYFV